MNETKRTPGDFHRVDFAVVDEKGQVLADCWLWGDLGNPEECEANADFFAAAPDLLYALKALLRGKLNPDVRSHTTTHDRCETCFRPFPVEDKIRLCPLKDCGANIARAAIAKAEPEASPTP